ncbi:MAG: hypothetical protein F6J93_13770 [Oscillatoria sp. SIO1A7]|nr:hypothetical protein [Oscillatoria sp. SIO1A7]
MKIIKIAKITLICDKLNVHKYSSIYKAFGSATARNLATKLDIHHTPKHGSWLNIAENELSALTRAVPRLLNFR